MPRHARPDPAVPSAMQTADEVRAVASQLSQTAEAFHRRLKREAATLDSGAIYARLAEEHRLRGLANQLYFEASERTLADAQVAQAQIEQALLDAQRTIEGAARFQHAMDLVADVLTLGAALVSRRPGPIVAALREVVRTAREG